MNGEPRHAKSSGNRSSLRLRLALGGEAVDGLGVLPFEAVGLVRGEFILRERCESLRLPGAAAALARYLDRVAREFRGRDVWYRLADLWSDEAATLRGTPPHLREHNPMLGLRGIRRGLADPEILEVELSLLAELGRDHPNLHMLVPYVEDADQFALIAERAAAAGHPNRIGSMLEIPAALLDASSFVRAGATNLLIGLNDLSCLMLGRDRGPLEIKLHPTLWRVVEEVRQALPDIFDWGIAGKMNAAVLQRAKDAGVPYACVHYADASALAGLPAQAFPHADHVTRVKNITERAKREGEPTELRRF
jgi:phosphoenolpyruvate-protein kinase (PTS system EI component)